MTSGRLESPGAVPQGQGPDLAGLSLQHTDPGLQRVEVMRCVTCCSALSRTAVAINKRERVSFTYLLLLSGTNLSWRLAPSQPWRGCWESSAHWPSGSLSASVMGEEAWILALAMVRVSSRSSSALRRMWAGISGWSSLTSTLTMPAM